MSIQQRAAILLGSVCEAPSCKTIPEVNGPVCLPKSGVPPPFKELPNSENEFSGGGKGPVLPMADFIYPEDRFLAYLACIVYGPRPHVINGAYLDSELTSDRIAVWKDTNTAYVICKGTSTFPEDLIDDLALSIGVSCNLTLVNEANNILANLQEKGYFNIQTAGHSLGGRAALCISGQSNLVKKCVVLNCGAPAISLGASVQTNARHYHIFGDIISTHEPSAENIRVQIGPVEYYKFSEIYKNYVTEDVALGFDIENNAPKLFPQTIKLDWLNPYWHGTERFYKSSDQWRIASAQEEQLSMEAYFLVEANVKLTIVSTAFSIFGLEFIELFKDAVCENPIPGANNGELCKTRSSVFKHLLDFVYNIVGVGVGASLAAIGSTSVALGGVAGLLLTKGDITGVLDFVVPGWTAITKAIRLLIENIFKIINDSQGDFSRIGKILIETLFDDLKEIYPNNLQFFTNENNKIQKSLLVMQKQTPDLANILYSF